MGGDQIVKALTDNDVESTARRPAPCGEGERVPRDARRVRAASGVPAGSFPSDVERSKPHPDIVHAGLAKVEQPGHAIMIGDSRWDIEAGARAGLETICVLTGGWSSQELVDAGALAVYESLPELIRGLDGTPLSPGPSR